MLLLIVVWLLVCAVVGYVLGQLTCTALDEMADTLERIRQESQRYEDL